MINRANSSFSQTRTDSYRYGFNGKEKVDELHNNSGDAYDFGARVYDPRLGRWLSLDPLYALYPDFSPYVGFNDSPIMFTDPDGQTVIVHYLNENGKKCRIKIITAEDIDKLKNVNSKFVQEIHRAFVYLQDEEVLSKTIETRKRIHLVQKTDEDVQVAFINKEVSSNPDTRERFPSSKPGKNTIVWDPFEGLEVVTDEKVPTGQIQSPALGLLHEFSHFLSFATDRKGYNYSHSAKAKGKFAPELEHYDNPQEFNAIELVENPAGERLGEPTRSNHYGRARKVENSTSRKPVENAPSKSPIMRH